MVAINSALSVDLTGQVCADSIGTRIYSGFGGQLDFIRGAARSKGGVPVIALPSTAKNGTVSRIVNTLAPGSGSRASSGARSASGRDASSTSPIPRSGRSWSARLGSGSCFRVWNLEFGVRNEE